jgi:DNA-binding MarR family transcriptional regulator
LQTLLYSTPPKSNAEQRKRSAVISRKLRMLRAHGLIRKLPHTHRYHVTNEGRQILNAVLLAHRITVRQILAAA